MKKLFKLNECYEYALIEKWATDNKFVEYEISATKEFLIGESFLVFKHFDKDLAISFMLDDANSAGGIYKCIYTDL